MKRFYILVLLSSVISGCGEKTQTLGVGSTQISPKDNMIMVYVPEGEFEMGASADHGYELCQQESDGCQRSWFEDEEPIHIVYLDAYWIDKYEVSNEMFAKFVEETGYQTDAEKTGESWVYADGDFDRVEGADWAHPQGPDSILSGLGAHPVMKISWNDAYEYCEWAGRRLPTEAEWEKGARGEDGRMYPWGDQELNGRLLNYADVNLDADWADSTANDGYKTTAPVGSYPEGASPYGALDMAGNVWEWVADWYDSDYYSSSPSENPQGPTSGTYRVLRGGSWSHYVGNVRSTLRNWNRPDYPEVPSIGFRCVASP